MGSRSDKVSIPGRALAPCQLRARTTCGLGPDGVRCTISIPVSETSGATEAPHA